MLARLFARKAAWLKFTAVKADVPHQRLPVPAEQRSVSQNMKNGVGGRNGDLVVHTHTTYEKTKFHLPLKKSVLLLLLLFFEQMFSILQLFPFPW